MILKSDLLLTEAPSRRGFIGGLRNLIVAGAGAAATHRLIMPAQALVTPDDAASRLKFHLEGAEAAMRDLFPGRRVEVRSWDNCISDHDRLRSHFDRGWAGAVACCGVEAHV